MGLVLLGIRETFMHTNFEAGIVSRQRIFLMLKVPRITVILTSSIALLRGVTLLEHIGSPVCLDTHLTRNLKLHDS